jgi:undecaprenyl-diphosphatase
MHTLVILIAKYFVAISAIVWLVVLARLPKQKRLQFIVFSAASAVLTAVLIKVGTTLHQDPRPFVRDHVQPYFSSSTDNGFPSDHTAFSALIGFVALRYYRWIGIAMLVLAMLIGAARVISGVHHGQDIVGGLLLAGLGVALTWAGERLVKMYLQRSAKE